MTAWTSPRTWVVGEKLFAALLNTHVRDNLLYIKEVLAGTHTDKLQGTALTTAFRFADNGTVTFDDFLGAKIDLYGDGNGRYTIGIESAMVFIRADGNVKFFDDADTPASSPPRWALDTTTGKVTGKGFYDSGYVTVANTATVTLAHGLGAIPRYINGLHNNGSGVARMPVQGFGAAGHCAWAAADATNLQITNNSGASRQVRAIAML